MISLRNVRSGFVYCISHTVCEQQLYHVSLCTGGITTVVTVCHKAKVTQTRFLYLYDDSTTCDGLGYMTVSAWLASVFPFPDSSLTPPTSLDDWPHLFGAYIS